jgi:hypothetical protein
MIEKLKKYISENIIHFANIFGYEITARFCELLALVFEDIDEKQTSRWLSTKGFEISKKNPIREIADYYGFNRQKLKLIEEMAELMQRLLKTESKYELSENLFEEIADVKIMLEQIEYLINSDYEINEIRQKKIKRTLDRVYEEKYQIDEAEAKECAAKRLGE